MTQAQRKPFQRLTDQQIEQWWRNLPSWPADPELEKPPEDITAPRRPMDYRRRIAALRVALTTIANMIPDISAEMRTDRLARSVDEIGLIAARALDDDLDG